MTTTTDDMQSQATSANGDTALARRATELVTPQGKTTIANVVVSKIAGIAAREVPGVHDLVGQGVGNLAQGALQRVGRADTRSAGVNVEVGEREAAVDLRLTVEYGVSIPELAVAVRSNVIERLQSMTGLRVKEVNIAFGTNEDQKSPRHPCFKLESPEALLKLQSRVWEHFDST